MADRTSAALFASVFDLLAEMRPPATESAMKLWEKSQHYDFHPYQMYCDDALVTLGLARRTDESIVYYGEDGFDGDL